MNHRLAQLVFFVDILYEVCLVYDVKQVNELRHSPEYLRDAGAKLPVVGDPQIVQFPDVKNGSA